ncbi:HD domain-containing protein [uncultured Marivita sp.]|uniref:HD domain-containing protein n=1 Tax=uncultured Marivita sp. TaxID=888080 RepID=UPI0026196B75|nr:HD domain-containing protein [uncultured Marivita sp.]
MTRLDQQMAFLTEADRLKSVLRATTLCDGSRMENSAEHSWHIALYALVLAEHAEQPLNTGKIVKMLLLHDLVEIDAGDAPVFADHDADALADREQAAADRIFGLLSDDQAQTFRDIWDEFEANETPEAQFAKSIDRMQPPMQNLASGGGSWIDYDVTYEKFASRIGPKIDSGAPKIWAWIQPKVAAFFASRD